MEEFQLNEILFIPAFNPPHKKAYSPYTTRLNMLRLAINGNPRFKISNVEAYIRGKTYTVDVIQALEKRIDGDLFLIIGSDQWTEINSWKMPDKISDYCRLIIIPRPGFAIKRRTLRKKEILVSHAPGIDISSTMIRRLIRSGRSAIYLVPRAVVKYIKRRKLYIS
jgi:nicotinate-nucleotide adenylyltransferase